MNFFNLKKRAQSDLANEPVEDFNFDSDANMDLPSDESAYPLDSVDDMQDESLKFETPEDLKKLIEENAENPDFVNDILKETPDESQSFVKDSIQRFYEPERDEADKTIIAAEIYKAIHGRGKGEQEVSATYTQASIKDLIRKSNVAISKFANQAVSGSTVKTAKAYNLKKQAQFHGSRNNDFITYGPDEKMFLPYSNTGFVGSRWHTWIRGRDHNFLFDDTAVDFETFWRGNIMDKYSRPYRNEKGEYVGGYINKRFEVDRNIPEGNNLQLLPGQKRRPYMPEYGTWEARMAAARDKHLDERGYARNEEKPEGDERFAFKSASVKKK
jgi:hypothetical protein